MLYILFIINDINYYNSYKTSYFLPPYQDRRSLYQKGMNNLKKEVNMSFLSRQTDLDQFSEKVKQKIDFGKWPPDYSLQEDYKKLNPSLKKKGSIYDEAIRLEVKRAYVLEKYEPKKILTHIIEEINIRTKITAHEIFIIGELLTLAKKILHEDGMSFKGWIHSNFDFSYETAINFMHVYQNCLGMRSVAVNLPLSKLYKISQPNFPTELRDFLFAQDNIDKMTDLDLKELKEKFKEGGFEAIESKIEKWNKDFHQNRQTQFVIDRCRSILDDMEKISEYINDKISTRISVPGGQEKERMLEGTIKIFNKLLDVIDEWRSALGGTLREVEDLQFDAENDSRQELQE
jgi:hypothetical protein